MIFRVDEINGAIYFDNTIAVAWRKNIDMGAEIFKNLKISKYLQVFWGATLILKQTY
jgi:hypothetical protein